MRQTPYEDRSMNTGKQQPKKAGNKKNNRTFNIIIYVVAGILFLTAGVLLFLEFVYTPNYMANKYPPGETVPDEELEALLPETTPVAQYDSIPILLKFMRQNEACNVYPVGVDKNNIMESIDDAKIASWLSIEPYVAPGDVGNAIIGGHNLWSGTAGTFSMLKDQQIGDTVAVLLYSESTNKQEWRYFRVIETHECDFDDTTYMTENSDGRRLLTLITCKGDWNTNINTSQHRVVVICELISG